MSLFNSVTPAATTARATNQVTQDSNIIYQNPWEVNTFSEPVSYSYPDLVTSAQGMVERELTGYLCILPGEVLQAVGEWIPEVGTRERAFWKLIKAVPRLQEKTLEGQITAVYSMAVKQGFYKDYLNWLRCDEHGISQEIIFTMLCKIKALHDARVGLDILAKNPEWIEGAKYDG